MDSKRTEKLVSALYLLTSFFEDREPMKWRLRELGGKLISSRSGSTVLEIMSLMSVAKNAGLISDANFDIISREFGRVSPSIQMLEDLFVREEPKIESRPQLAEERTEERPASKLEPKTFYLGSSVQNRSVPKDVKDKIVRDHGVIEVKRNSRQTTIINLLKKKKEIQVTDVSPLIPGVSEKTIQRELLSMVSAGILRKIGEKRWSKYTLAE